MKPKLKRGLIQIYTGPGKGKTTAALGLAIRARGQGLRVCIFRFLKEEPGGEAVSLSRLGIRQVSLPGVYPCPARPLSREEREKLEKELARGLARIKRIIKSRQYDLIILDEVNFLLHKKLLRVRDILFLIKSKPATLELVLTGRGAPAALLGAADLVTEMKAVKHPYRRGIKARKGIEY